MTTPVKLLVIYVLVILIGRFISQGQRKQRQLSGSQLRAIMQDWTALLVSLSAVIGFTLPVLEAVMQETFPTRLPMRIVGLAIIILSWRVTYAGNRAIARSWSPTIDKDENQSLVTSGVYAFVRHPLYFSGILLLVGTNIYFGSTWAWLGAAVSLLAIVIRVPIEERRLVERFGEAYVEYQKRTKAIVPWLV